MARFETLTVYQLARQNLRDITVITRDAAGFGDLTSQIRRAAILAVSNICEGSSGSSRKQFARYLTIARASVNELQGQLAILSDLGFLDPTHPIVDRADLLGRSLTRFIQALNGQCS